MNSINYYVNSGVQSFLRYFAIHVCLPACRWLSIFFARNPMLGIPVTLLLSRNETNGKKREKS